MGPSVKFISAIKDAIFNKKNLPPFLLLKIALMAETNFTLGPTSKTNKFPVLMVIICPELAGFK